MRRAPIILLVLALGALVAASASAARPATPAERAAILSSARFWLPKVPNATPVTLGVACVSTVVPGYAATAFRGGSLGYPGGPIVLWRKVDAHQPRPWFIDGIAVWQRVWFMPFPAGTPAQRVLRLRAERDLKAHCAIRH
jgi:hypothetical protein